MEEEFRIPDIKPIINFKELVANGVEKHLKPISLRLLKFIAILG